MYAAPWPTICNPERMPLFDAPVPPEYTAMTMQPLRAYVHNGRLVLDEPPDLPEGEVVYLRPVDDCDDGLDEEERRALHQALDEGITAARAGEHVDAEDFVRELLARG